MRSRPDAGQATFFLDRGLGRHVVAEMLRQTGHIALPMAEVYPDGHDQLVGDDEWIADASAQGWIALTKDSSLIRDHEPALARSTLRVFALNNANLSGAVMADRYRANLGRILARAAKPGPYVYVVTSTGVERRWPR